MLKEREGMLNAKWIENDGRGEGEGHTYFTSTPVLLHSSMYNYEKYLTS
jgi:hypothetical protein